MSSSKLTTKAEVAKAVKDKFTPEQLNNGKIVKEAIEELLHDDPENLYYSISDIKSYLLVFLMADRNLDGNVEQKELLAALDHFEFSEDAKKYYKKFFDVADYSDDKKCSLAEWFICGLLYLERVNDYPLAKKVE